jgi:hypothetical protein
MTNDKISKLKNIIHLYTNTENMTNNKQTTIIELFLNEIGKYIDTSEITDSLIEKYILII